MSEQSNPEVQSTQTLEEFRQFLLDQLDTSESAIAELSDEQLAEVAGGASVSLLRRTLSAPGRLEGNATVQLPQKFTPEMAAKYFRAAEILQAAGIKRPR